MEKRVVPKYAHLEYQVLHELEITIPEYFFLDMVYRLSRGMWCNKKLVNIAQDMRMTKRGVTVMRDRLISRKLLIKGISNRLKTSEKVNSMYFLDETRLTKSELSSEKVNSVHRKSELNVAKTPVESNNRITKNNLLSRYKTPAQLNMPDLSGN